jgi:hypothetical protein
MCSQVAYSAVLPVGHAAPPQRSYARIASLLAAGLAVVCVLALASHAGGTRSDRASLAIAKALHGAYRSGEFGQTRQHALSMHLQSLQGANATGNATANGEFDLSAWLDSQPKGTWAEWVSEHPEQQPYDLDAYLNSVPKFDLNAYLNGQPQPSPEAEVEEQEEEEEEEEEAV